MNRNFETLEKRTNELREIYFPVGTSSVSNAQLTASYYFVHVYSQNKETWDNGISHNDPLSLLIAVDFRNKTIEYVRRSVTIKPQEKYLAYSSEVLKLRKTRFKDEADLYAKLEKAIKKARDTMKDLKEKDLLAHEVSL